MTTSPPASSKVVIEIMPLDRDLGDTLAWPARQTPQAAGFDLTAAPKAPVTLAPGGRALIGCGFAMALPPGFEAQIRPRSGLALKHGVTVLNAPGTIDSDYRGEVQVLLINHSDVPFVVERGMRIAQLLIARVEPAAFEVVSELRSTARGAGGFGSTGVGPA